MFGTIRKHQTWLWFIIIGLMVLSMITWNQMGRQGNARRAGGLYGAIDGRPITDTEYRNAQAEASLMYYLRTFEWPDSSATRAGWNQEQQAYERIFLVRKLEQYNIRSDPDAVAQLAGLILRQLGSHYNTHLTLEDLVVRVLNPQGISADDFERFLQHDLSIQQLISIVGASGKMISPSEIQSLYVQEHQEVKTEAVFFSSSNYLASIPEPSPTVLAEFYTNELAEYREPDKMQISYVRFNITNYLADAEKQLGTNLPGQVDYDFNRMGTNVLTFGKTPEEQKAKIRDILIRETALSNANVAAVSFQKDLLSKEPARADNLAALAKEKGMEAKVTKPFDKEYGPSDIELPPRFTAADLFNLTPDDPFVETPVPSPDGVYLFAFNKFIPSRVPPLDEIRSRVIADFKNMQAVHMAQMTGQIFAQSVTNGMARGQTFSAIAAGTKIKPVTLPAFSASTETLPEVEDQGIDLRTFKQVALNTPPGKASGLVRTANGGMVVYVHERLPLDETKMKAELPDFANTVRQQRANDAFEIWFSREANAALQNIPALQRQARS